MSAFRFCLFFCFVVFFSVFPAFSQSGVRSVAESFSVFEIAASDLKDCASLRVGRDSCYADLCEYDSGYLCAEDLLDAAIPAVGPDKAMLLLHDIMQSPIFDIQTDGHLLAHVIGRSLSKHFGSSGENFLRCPHDFNDGCYHGFFEDSLVKVDNPVEVAVSICEDMPLLTTSRKQKSYCYHGAGHVFLMNESSNLDRALSHCASVPEEWIESCLGGLFMENAWPSRNWEEKKKNFKEDDLLFPCNVLEDRFKSACYREHYSYLVNMHTTILEELIAICLGAEGYVGSCL